MNKLEPAPIAVYREDVPLDPAGLLVSRSTARADAWGWRLETVGAGQFARDEWRPRGHCIGWIDGADLYLQPEASYAEAQELGREMGDGLPIGARTLWQRMYERRLLASRDTARQRYTVRRTLGGVLSRDVIHLLTDTIYPCLQPSKPSNNAPAPHPDCAAVLDGSPCATVHVDGATVQTPSDRPNAAAAKLCESCDGAATLDGLDGLDGRCDIYPHAGANISAPADADTELI